MNKIYRKTATIKAEQFDGSAEMVKKYGIRKDTEYMLSDDPLEYQTAPYQIETLDSWININIDDWIATGVNDEHWTITDDVFKKSYAELPVIPKNVDEYIRWCQGEGGVGNVSDAMDYAHGDVASWIYDERNSDTFARALLDGYVVEDHD